MHTDSHFVYLGIITFDYYIVYLEIGTFDSHFIYKFRD